MKCRILIADDHEIFRRGLREIISTPDFEVVGEAASGRDAIEKARQLKPDLVIMDISMPELNGLEATRQIVGDLPGTEILILTMHESEQLVRQVLDAGARGYMLKSDASRDLLMAIQALRSHRPFFTTRISEMVLTAFLRKGEGEVPLPHAGAGGRLTPRERQIVQLLGEGLSNKEVAAKLGISVKTAETHRSRIMAKLNLRSVGELVRYAVRNGIIEA